MYIYKIYVFAVYSRVCSYNDCSYIYKNPLLLKDFINYIKYHYNAHLTNYSSIT